MLVALLLFHPAQVRLGFPSLPFCPSLSLPTMTAFKRLALCESYVRLNARRDIISLATGRNPSVGCERSRRLSRLMHKDSPHGSTFGQRLSGTIAGWHGMPTLELCSN
jgi:hypothetical protein